jgi:transposase
VVAPDGVGQRSNSARLQREVATQGSAGKITILKDFLKPFRPAVPSKATMRYETAPGEQVFSMVLSFSRLMYLEFIEHQDLGTLIRCPQNPFGFLGGHSEEAHV